MADTTTADEFDCKSKGANFCYVCAKYVSDKLKTKFTKLSQERYMKLFQTDNLKNFGYSFVGKVVCGSCKGRLGNRTRHEGKFNVPAIWHAPKDEDHEDCYLCQTNLSDLDKSDPRKFEYDGSLSVELPKIVDKLPDASVFEDSDLSDEEEERMNPADQTNADMSRLVNDSIYVDDSKCEDESRVGERTNIVEESKRVIETEPTYEEKSKNVEEESNEESNEEPNEEPNEESNEVDEGPGALDESRAFDESGEVSESEDSEGSEEEEEESEEESEEEE